MHRDLAVVRLDHRDGVLRRVDHRFQLLDLFLITALKDRQPRLGAGQLGQLAVNLRGAALQMVDTHRRGNLLQLLHRHVAAGLGDDQFRPDGSHRFQIDIGCANKADIAVIEIDTGELGAGAQIVAAVRARAAVAGDRWYPELNQRNSNIEIVHRNNALRMQRDGDGAA